MKKLITILLVCILSMTAVFATLGTATGTASSDKAQLPGAALMDLTLSVSSDDLSGARIGFSSTITKEAMDANKTNLNIGTTEVLKEFALTYEPTTAKASTGDQNLVIFWKVRSAEPKVNVSLKCTNLVDGQKSIGYTVTLGNDTLKSVAEKDIGTQTPWTKAITFDKGYGADVQKFSITTDAIAPGMDATNYKGQLQLSIVAG